MDKKNIKKNPFLSVIIPFYNEESRLKNLSKLCRYLNSLDFDFEVLLVNDGSTDNSLKKLKALEKKLKFKIYSYSVNEGKGAAIKIGMLRATGNYRLFTDIDLSTPIQEFNKFIPFLKKQDILIGSRKIKGATLKKRQPLARENMGKAFTKLSQVILNLDISDFTCGFKCFSKKASKKIFLLQRITGWGFDSEILFIAKRLGFNIKEIPVVWTNDPKTKVKFPQDIISSLFDLLKIRLHDFLNRYEKVK